MGRISVSKDRTYFMKDGRPFFYLADTAWMAFEKLSLSEWEEYVYRRREQGFNVIQISMLPIAHDHSEGAFDLHPFGVKEGGKTDFFTYKEAYFQKAERMLEILDRAGMIPCLHLLWVNYIPDTWAAKLSPDTVFPFEAVAPFVQMAAARYRKFTPMYSISGDTSFESEQVTAYYVEALKVLKETDPDSLATLHLQPQAKWPKCLIEDERLDFYTYQGGHSKEQQDHNCEGAVYFMGLNKVRPIMNTEPPYEGHGWGYRYGRFDAFDIRMALWQSILSGAKAGAGYGAHGVWMFQTRNSSFNNRSFSDVPYGWRTALEFDGAWDAGYAKWIYETYHFHTLLPADLTHSRLKQVKTAMSPDENLVVIYLPYPTELEVSKDLRDYQAVVIDLDKKHVLEPEIEFGAESIIRLCGCCKDALMIFWRGD